MRNEQGGHSFVKSELVIGGQKSGKSRWAEYRARTWLAQSPQHAAVLIATAQPGDEEMRLRIARHQADRAQRVPGMVTVEEPLQLAQAITAHSQPHTLVVVDCLTLWLTNWLMPSEGHAPQQAGVTLIAPQAAVLEEKTPENAADIAQAAMLLVAIEQSTGPVVLVGNEIGLGVIPMGADVRAFVDTLGRLNQDVARTCRRETLMAAGLPLTLKGIP